jgi:hypothetical protein
MEGDCVIMRVISAKNPTALIVRFWRGPTPLLTVSPAVMRVAGARDAVVFRAVDALRAVDDLRAVEGLDFTVFVPGLTLDRDIFNSPDFSTLGL